MNKARSGIGAALVSTATAASSVLFILSSCSTSPDESDGCGQIAACYVTTISVDPSASAVCLSLPKAGLLDLSSTQEGRQEVRGCTRTLSGCTLVEDCPNVKNGRRSTTTLSFNASGFSGTGTETFVDSGEVCTISYHSSTKLACSPLNSNDGGADAADANAPDGLSSPSHCNDRNATPCPKGFACDQNSGRCGVDMSAMWTAAVEGAAIASTDPADGLAWDIGGTPDVYVCGYLGGVRSCTSTVDDTAMPTWSPPAIAILFKAPASRLISDLDLEAWDEDGVTDDPICPRGRVTLTSADFSSGFAIAGCPTDRSTARITLKLSPSD